MEKIGRKGFTLIELLVVIAIIGLISSVVLASLNSARAKGADARRRADMHAMRNAIQLYYDSTGAFPINRNPGFGYPDTSPNFLQELVTAGYLAAIPHSLNPNIPYYYYDYGPGSTAGALLVTQLEAATPTATGYPGTCRPWGPAVNWCDQASNRYYCLCNPY